MKHFIVHLLLFFFSAQVMAVVAGEYATNQRVSLSELDEVALNVQLSPVGILGAETRQGSFDETQAFCAIEEMSDYVALDLSNESRKRYAHLVSPNLQLYASIFLPKPLPPPRL